MYQISVWVEFHPRRLFLGKASFWPAEAGGTASIPNTSVNDHGPVPGIPPLPDISRHPITTRGLPPAFPGGSSVWARCPVLFLVSLRQSDMLFTVTGMAVPPAKDGREYLTSSV